MWTHAPHEKAKTLGGRWQMAMWLTEGTPDMVFMKFVISGCAVGAVVVVLSGFLW